MKLHHTKYKGDLAVTKIIHDLTVKGYIVSKPIVAEHTKYDLIVDIDDKLIKLQCKYLKDNRVIPNRTSWNDKNGNHQTYYKSTDFDYYAVYLPEMDKVIYPHFKFGGFLIRSSITDLYTAGNEFYWYEDFLSFTDEAERKTIYDFPEQYNKHKPTKEKLEDFYINQNLSIPQISEKCNVTRKTIWQWLKDFDIKKSKEKIIETAVALSGTKKDRFCSSCNAQMSIGAIGNLCINCYKPETKIEWPLKEELQRLVWEKPTSVLGKELGVSDKAIEKKCKKLGIEKPPRGYWAKLEAEKL